MPKYRRYFQRLTTYQTAGGWTTRPQEGVLGYIQRYSLRKEPLQIRRLAAHFAQKRPEVMGSVRLGN
jgi:hypothetical protein